MLQLKVNRYLLCITLCLASLTMYFVLLSQIWTPQQELQIEKRPFIPNMDTLSSLTPPGIIISTQGGMGNQMFRFAAAYSLSRQLGGIPIYFDSNREIDHQRPFLLSKFSLDLKIGALNLVGIPDNKTNLPQITLLGDIDLFNKTWNCTSSKFLYLHDYFQSEYFFVKVKQQIRTMFQIPEENLATRDNAKFKYWGDLIAIKNGQPHPVAVHIRRGDYSSFWQTPLQFYHLAMIEMMSKLDGKAINFFVFSDSIQEIKATLLNSEQLSSQIVKTASTIHFVSGSGLSALQEFYLITQCRHMILSYSSYGWWGAYLMQDYDNAVILRPPINLNHFQNNYTFNATNAKKPFKLFMLENYYYPKEWIEIDSK